MVSVIGGVPELYEPACHFRCCKSSVAALLQPWRAKKLRDKSIKHRVTFSSCPRLHRVHLCVKLPFKSLYTLHNSRKQKAGLPFDMHIQIQALLKCFRHTVFLPISTHPTSSLPRLIRLAPCSLSITDNTSSPILHRFLTINWGNVYGVTTVSEQWLSRQMCSSVTAVQG